MDFILLQIPEIIGRFHPVLVHLPIGILVIACVFQWISARKIFQGLKPAIPWLMLAGGVSAVFSCITGYLLSGTAEYNEIYLSNHQWLGISTALVSFGLYYLLLKGTGRRLINFVSALLLLLITITGHLGGSLTHGEDYLTEFLQLPEEKNKILAAIPQIQDALAYKQVITPIFEARCYNCHGPNKQKGKLRLDSRSAIEKGGEEGEVLVPGKAEESELIKRLLLSMDAKKHMPPKNKSQLTDEEIKILHWWVDQGADFSGKIKDLKQSPQITQALLAMQSGNYGQQEKKSADVPEQPVAAAAPAAIKILQDAGVMVIPVAQGSNYLSVNFISAWQLNDTLIRSLAPLKDQLVWLKMDGLKLSDASIKMLATCTRLTRLQLNYSTITDQQLGSLNTLRNLQSLHLIGTAVTAKGILALGNLTGLKNIYVYKSAVNQQDYSLLSKKFSGIRIDTGNYQLPFRAEDTVIVTQPQ